MNHDGESTINDLKAIVKEFVDEREWKKFHSPKNLSMSLAIEAAELMEHFQWIGIQESRELDADQQIAAGEELADVICYSLALANEMNIDVTSTLQRKMKMNRAKYPVEQFKGRFGESDSNPAQL